MHAVFFPLTKTEIVPHYGSRKPGANAVNIPQMSLKQTLIEAAERHCRQHGISKARLASIVVNDGKFFDRIERGGGFTAETYERFMAHFARADARRAAAIDRVTRRREGGDG